MVTASEIVVFVHGVPQGFDVWSDDHTDDTRYIESLYHATERTFMFMAEVRTSEGKPFCYYHYLIYDNVLGCDSRAGSYFGLTIRLDAYCKDWRTIFSIMDVAFKTQVLGKLLTSDCGKLRFAVKRLSDANGLLKEVEENIVDLFVGAFACKNIDFFESLSDFALSSGNCWKNNLGDCQLQDMGKALKDVGKAVLSPDYPSVKTETLKDEYREKLRREKKRFIDLQETSRREVEYMEREMSKLNAETTKLRHCLHEKEEEIRRLKDMRPMEAEEKDVTGKGLSSMPGNHAPKPKADFSWWSKPQGAKWLLSRKAKER